MEDGSNAVTDFDDSEQALKTDVGENSLDSKEETASSEYNGQCNTERDELNDAPQPEQQDGEPLDSDAIVPANSADVISDGMTTGSVSRRSEEAAKYWELVDKNRQDFSSWTTLISIVEKEDELEAVQEVYNEFLIYFPYCYGYWKKYADYVAAKDTKDAAQKVYEDAILAIGLSVDLWIHYIDFCLKKEGMDEDEIRGLFLRAVESCGIEFRSDQLWDKYIDWETKHDGLINITQIYKRLLNIPTKCYVNHYENLKHHIDNHSLSQILTSEELRVAKAKAEKMLAEDKSLEIELESTASTTNSTDISNLSEPIKRAIKVVLYDEFHEVYVANEKETAKRWSFEENIRRPYFHNKALDAAQLRNWRDYLDFEISEADEGRIVTLFERCLIACAQYEEFWIKYASYLEGMDRQIDVRNVYTRACRQHLPYKASIHITWAFYEERQGNYDMASAIIENIETHAPDNMCVLNHKLNLLRRHGNDLCEIYEQYIDQKKLSDESVKLLISKYARYLHKIKCDTERAIDVLTKAIENYQAHEPFYTQLLDIEYQRQPLDEDKILAVFDLVNSSELAQEVKQKFYSRRYEFIDDLGSDVNRLYNLYQKHEETVLAAAKERKRNLSSSGTSLPDESAKKPRTASYEATPTTYTTTDTSYSSYQQPAYAQSQYYNGMGDWSQYYNQSGYTGAYPGYQQSGYGYTGYDYTGYY